MKFIRDIINEKRNATPEDALAPDQNAQVDADVENTGATDAGALDLSAYLEKPGAAVEDIDADTDFEFLADEDDYDGEYDDEFDDALDHDTPVQASVPAKTDEEMLQAAKDALVSEWHAEKDAYEDTDNLCAADDDPFEQMETAAFADEYDDEEDALDSMPAAPEFSAALGKLFAHSSGSAQAKNSEPFPRVIQPEEKPASLVELRHAMAAKASLDTDAPLSNFAVQTPHDTPPIQTPAQSDALQDMHVAEADTDAPIDMPAPAMGRGSSRSGRVKTRLLGFTPGSIAQEDPFEKAGKANGGAFAVGWLVVIEGPGRGASFTLQDGVSKIGRGEDQSVALNFGDNSISRENHISLAFDGELNQFYIGHSGKSNLVRLNNKPLLSTEEVKSGDTIRLGETTLRLVALCGEDFSWTASTPKDAKYA